MVEILPSVRESPSATTPAADDPVQVKLNDIDARVTRIERVISFHARDAASPSADEVISQLVDGVYTNAAAATPYERGVRRQARRAVLAGPNRSSRASRTAR